MWGYTAGVAIGERQRTLRSFAGSLQTHLKGVDGDKIAIYGMGNSSLIFYLDMARPIATLSDMSAVCSYVKGPGNYLLTEEARADEIAGQCGPHGLVRVLAQPDEGKKSKREAVVLFRTGKPAQNPFK
jgi:hypothetical protein